MVAKKEKEKEIKVRESYEVTRLSEDYLSGVYDTRLSRNFWLDLNFRQQNISA